MWYIQVSTVCIEKWWDKTVQLLRPRSGHTHVRVSVVLDFVFSLINENMCYEWNPLHSEEIMLIPLSMVTGWFRADLLECSLWLDNFVLIFCLSVLPLFFFFDSKRVNLLVRIISWRRMVCRPTGLLSHDYTATATCAKWTDLFTIYIILHNMCSRTSCFVVA